MADTGSDGGLRNTLYRRLTRSGRRMTAARRLLYAMVVPLGLDRHPDHLRLRPFEWVVMREPVVELLRSGAVAIDQFYQHER